MASPHFPHHDVLHVAAGIFGSSAGMTVTRVPGGHSTFVYRMRRGEATWYLRVLPEEEDSFAPEARVHAIPRDRGVRVPDVIYWEHRHPLLQRSVMVTTEFSGRPIAPDMTPEALRVILDEAGRDLARINRVPVTRFGWIRRDRSEVTTLEAEVPTLRAFVLEDIAERGPWLDRRDGVLAHGDFHCFASPVRSPGFHPSSLTLSQPDSR